MLRLGCLLPLKQDLVPHLDYRGDLDVGGQAVAFNAFMLSLLSAHLSRIRLVFIRDMPWHVIK